MSESIRDELRTFITREILRRPDYPLRDDEPLLSSGLIDSFALAAIGAHIERAFGVYVADTELTAESMDTLDAMAKRVAASRV